MRFNVIVGLPRMFHGILGADRHGVIRGGDPPRKIVISEDFASVKMLTGK